MKKILISGSSKGLGFNLAQIFREKSWTVYTMGNSTNTKVDIRVDLTDELATKRELESFFLDTQIDVLVCNAGTGKLPMQYADDEELSRYFLEKNFATANNLINSMVPFMKYEGSVIAISSIVALKVIAGAPKAYSEAKKQLNEYIRNLAKIKHEKSLRFNLISPGNIIFPGSRWEEIVLKDHDFVKNLLENEVPLGRFINPKEIASAIDYLSSFEARNITGTNLVIDGGQSL